jgi:Fe-S oxidoreductase
MFLSDKERVETIWACRFCPMCQHADRVTALVRRESYAPRGRGGILFALEKGFIKPDETVADIMYTTINDGLLQEWCVGNYDHEELMVDARTRLFGQGLAPAEVKAFVDRLHAGPEGEEPSTILGAAGLAGSPKAEVLLFSGCSARKEGAGTIVSMGKLLRKAGIPFQVLEKEPCCGWPLYQLGDREGAQAFSAAIAKAIQASGARTVVALDGDCYRMLQTRTARLGGDLPGVRIVHSLQALSEWIGEGRITIGKRLAGTVTYHDPCALARYCEDTESARKILGVLLDGELKEMATHHRFANCCGAGGMLGVSAPEVARRAAGLRLGEARETGASVLATGCSRCTATLNGAGGAGPGLRVASLVDLLAEAVG